MMNMKYVIVTIEWCLSKGISVPPHARKSIDGTKVILHYDFIAPVLTDEDNVPVYWHSSPEMSSILNSEEWSASEEEDSII